MKKLKALFLFVAPLVMILDVSANAYLYPSDVQKMQQVQQPNAQGLVWPNTMPVYQWPNMQQQAPMMKQPIAVPSYPQARSNIPAYPYVAPRYNTAYPYQPPVLRFPASQTFQQARPVYSFNKPYATPMMPSPYANQYGYPVANQQTMIPQGMTPPNNITNPQLNPQSQKTYPPFRKKIKKKKKPWGDTRHIWPDFYTDSTGDMWDDMMNAPYNMGRMPGGWRAPSLSTPDPVTVGDAVANQVPPVIDEVPNFMPFMN